MRKKSRPKSIHKDITPSESEAAYEEAQLLVQDRNEGYVPYDMILTSLEQVKASFTSIAVGDLLNFLGHEFYWKRPSGEALVLYGKNEEKEELKGRGLIEICRFRVPEAWIGVGRFRIAWPERAKNEDEVLFLIGLYLYSTNVSDFDYLVSNENANAAFMAVLFLDQENAELFDSLAEERYESLR